MDFKDSVRSFGLKVLRMIEPRLGLRPDDIIVASYPKSGSTWLRFIIANVVSLRGYDGETVDFHALAGPYASEFDPLRLPSKTLPDMPRFLKTHRDFAEDYFGQNRRVLLWRHPFDTLVSFFEYRSALKGHGRFHGSLSEFIRTPEWGVDRWIEFHKGWTAVADALVSYGEMKRDATMAVQGLLDACQVRISGEILEEAVSRSTFERVRRLEEDRGLDSRGQTHLNSGFRFARSGRMNQWEGRFDRDDLEFLTESLASSGLPKRLNLDLPGC